MFSFFKKKYSYFNVLLNHAISDDCTLLSEISIIAKNEKQAEEIAKFQIEKINQELQSSFIIEKLWKLKKIVPNKFFNKNKVEINISTLKKESFYLINYNNHLNYLKQEHQSTFPKVTKPVLDKNIFIK